MSKLKQRIIEDMKSAMKAKDKEGLKAIRMILGAIKQREVDERIELVDEQVLAVIQKMVKQRKDSISQFKDAGRTDLIEIEEAELVVINNYMPGMPCNATELVHFRKRIGVKGFNLIFKMSVALHGKQAQESRVVILNFNRTWSFVVYALILLYTFIVINIAFRVNGVYHTFIGTSLTRCAAIFWVSF
jgi:uncharacterized protein YqeY